LSAPEAAKPAPAPAPVAAPEPVPVSSPIKPIGTLSINHVIEPTAESEKPAEEAIDPLKALLKKKPATAAKKGTLGAKKLTSSRPEDTKIESFEAVERRAQQLAAKEAAKANEEGDGTTASDRISAMLKEADAPKTSIYRTAPAPVPTTSAPASIYRMTQETNKPASSVGESNSARQKYGNAKSISSDQYFGRDQEDPNEVRTKLEKFSGSSAISSDMFYNNRDSGDYNSRGRYDNNSDDFSMDKLKESVSGFWSDLQKRVG
jgi:ADP-ribosylation factor GTPase-activating protein 2/3